MYEVVSTFKGPATRPLTFIHRASPESSEAFFASVADSIQVISDIDGVLFKAFKLGRGSLGQLLGPRAVWRALMAMLHGNFVGKPTGHETQMPGAFVVHQRQILWEHRARHAGDQPNLDAAMRALNGFAAEPAT